MGKNQPGVLVFIQGKVFYRGAGLWIIVNSLLHKELAALLIRIIEFEYRQNRFFENDPVGGKRITCG
jgi:hypothetical protein